MESRILKKDLWNYWKIQSTDMGLFDSIKRWKKIVKDAKKSDDKINVIHRNKPYEMLQENRFLVKEEKLSYKTVFRNHEFSVYSQNGEDGLIAAILKETGINSYRFIEFGFGNGRQCNSAFLALHCGWDGLFIDGNKTQTDSAKKYFEENLKGGKNHVVVENAFIVKENINELFSKNGFTGEIDVLSIDIDGNDWWIWEKIDCVEPTLVVMEYNPVPGPEKNVVVKYDSAFERFAQHASGCYYGASLTGYTKLANKKGYALVGCDSNGINAFYVKRNKLKGWLKEISPAEAYYEDFKCRKAGGWMNAFEKVKEMPYESA